MHEVFIHRFQFELNNYWVEEMARFGIHFPSGIPMINSGADEM
jgi:hypothetical protein